MSNSPATDVATPSRAQKSVLVTGANGFLGSAVARTFSRAGYITYGLVRRASSASSLYAAEVIPIIGSSSSPANVLSTLGAHTKTLDIIVGTTEQHPDYQPHHEDNVVLFRQLAETSMKAGVKPLLIFTSGCKDYGHTGLHGSAGLAPHTEKTPLDPPPFMVQRTQASETVLRENQDVLDAVSTRPTPLWGNSGSFYAVLFGLAKGQKEAEEGGETHVWEMKVQKDTILHGAHVDDVAESYVSIAEAERDLVKGKVYNMSAWRYETMEEIVDALRAEYGIKSDVTWGGQSALTPLLDYSQWVGSDRIRTELGWVDRRRLFSEAVGVYRKAYEEAVRVGDERPRKMQETLDHVFKSK